MKTRFKMTFPFLFACFLVLQLPLSAQVLFPGIEENPVPEGPIAEIMFEETTFDFGVVQSGDIVTHVYTFTNTSDVPLILTNAKGSCGCTVPQWPRQPIAPGETASITVEFNSKNKRGKRNQKVTITANTNPPQTFIYLTGDVESTDDEITIGEELEVIQPTVKQSKDCIAIYPNPTAEILKLEMDESSFGKAANISIFSQTGQLMAQRPIEAIEGTIEFNVSHFPAGTYIANIQVGDGIPETQCFIVNH